ncbi:MFS transporter [Chromatiales bacterium (ex Bugula neritina AB1)]|nr:MFS transporter [Chromatiales bacterium (ex Bugula neritina AB1)]
MTTPVAAVSSWRTPAVVIVAGCLIALLGFGIRSSFGLFLEPMTQARGWSRETFALALAIQNLIWGIGVPIAGAIADRFGASRVIIIGTLLYTAGLYGMSVAESSSALHLTAGLLTGAGVAFTAFSLAMAAMARVVSPQKRSVVLGLGTAAGSCGQVLFSPLSQGFISSFGWQEALLLQAGIALFLIPLAIALPGKDKAPQQEQEAVSVSGAVSEALAHRGFVLLTAGFFVCGFHVAFIAVHFPAYVRDLGLTAEVGAWSLSIIGLFNIIGSFGSGYAGQKSSKKNSLCFIYLARAVVIGGLLVMPKTAATIYGFSALMGLLWLSTVPLTTGLVAQIFGVRYLATLFGIVFLSHQIGSFIGVWLGGRLYDMYGSYDGMWWAGIFFGLVAAVVHWPINEKPLARLNEQSA